MRHTEMMAHMNMEKMQTVSAIKRHQVKTVHFIQVVFSLSVTLYETLVVLYHSIIVLQSYSLSQNRHVVILYWTKYCDPYCIVSYSVIPTPSIYNALLLV